MKDLSLFALSVAIVVGMLWFGHRENASCEAEGAMYARSWSGGWYRCMHVVEEAKAPDLEISKLPTKGVMTDADVRNMERWLPPNEKCKLIDGYITCRAADQMDEFTRLPDTQDGSPGVRR